MGFLLLTNVCTKALVEREVGSDLKYQTTLGLHVNVGLSFHPRAFVTSLLKFRLVHKEGARKVLFCVSGFSSLTMGMFQTVPAGAPDP